MTVLLALVGRPVTAQPSDRRQGLWGGVAVAQAWSKATCSVCLAQESGPAARASLGGTMSSRLLAGVEATAWLKGNSQTERSLFMATAVGTYYPMPAQGLHLKAGVGGYWYVEEDAAAEVSTQGLAFQVGAGYDLPISPSLSLSPFATWTSSGFSNPTRLDKVTRFRLPLVSDMKVRFFEIGLGVTIH